MNGRGWPKHARIISEDWEIEIFEIVNYIVPITVFSKEKKLSDNENNITKTIK